MQLARVTVGRGQAEARNNSEALGPLRAKKVAQARGEAPSSQSSMARSLAQHPGRLARFALELRALFTVEDGLAADFPGLQGLGVLVDIGGARRHVDHIAGIRRDDLGGADAGSQRRRLGTRTARGCATARSTRGSAACGRRVSQPTKWGPHFELRT